VSFSSFLSYKSPKTPNDSFLLLYDLQVTIRAGLPQYFSLLTRTCPDFEAWLRVPGSDERKAKKNNMFYFFILFFCLFFFSFLIQKKRKHDDDH